MLAAFRGGRSSKGLLILGPQEIGCHTAIDMRPGKDFRTATFTASVEIRVETGFIQAFEPEIVFELIIPGIKPGATGPGGEDDRAQAAVTAGEDAFDIGGLGFMPVVLDRAAAAQLFLEVELMLAHLFEIGLGQPTGMV